MLHLGNPGKKFQGFELFEVESAADTLVKAEMIKTDKKMFNAASKLIGERMIAERLAKKGSKA